MSAITGNEEIQSLLNLLTERRKNRFLQVVNERTRYITVVLENIHDPHNGSACLRSCEANGIQDVYIIERTNTFSTKESVAAGSGKWLTLYKFSAFSMEKNSDPTEACIKTLMEKGYRIYGMSSRNIPGKTTTHLTEVPLDKPVALVFGSEKDGLSDVAISLIPHFVKIPMYGFVESYNISVACAISVFTLTQKLKHSSLQWQLSPEEQKEILKEWIKKDFPHLEK